MHRTVFEPDHEEYRATVRAFVQREVEPHYARWEQDCLIDRSVWPVAAQQGIYALEIPEAYGGAGVSDYRHRLVVCEEVARAHATSFGVTLGLFDDIVLSYLLHLTTDEQRQRWLPRMASGELVTALALTEPGTGSDLRGITTAARRQGSDWVLNGSKTFISSGTNADLVLVAARTGEGRSDFSLLAVEADMPGFVRGRKLEKVGLHAQDTAELFFQEVRVPAENVVGAAGDGLRHLMSNLPRERMSIVAQAYASARAIFAVTCAYAHERRAFGKPIIDNQHVRFELAEMATDLDVAEAYVDRSALALNAGELTPVDAAKGKWYLSELLKRVVDRCVQLHGGYGYMLEYPVARAYVDARVQTIYGGTTEIMKEIIGRDLGADGLPASRSTP